MAIDPTSFHLLNIADSCSIWNLLSSRLLWSRATSASCHFSCTEFVIYECLLKPRKIPTASDTELQSRLRKELEAKKIIPVKLDLADLQDVEVLETRKKLGKGELSSIAIAKRIGFAVLTDDQKARRLAETAIPNQLVQTVPQLASWLLYRDFLGDTEFEQVLHEHESVDRPLRKHFEAARLLTLEARLADHHGRNRL